MSNGHDERDLSRVSPHVGRRLGIAASAALLSGLLLVPAPGSADPTAVPDGRRPSPSITEVKARLDTLNHQAEIAAESYNTVKVQMQQASARLTGLQVDVHRQRLHVASLRRQIVGAALSDYASSGGLSTSSSFLVARNPSQFIDALATNAVVEQRSADLLTQFQQQSNVLGVQEKQAEREVAAIRSDRAALARHKSAVEAKLADAKALLGHLEEQARQRLLALQRKAAAAAAARSARVSRSIARPPISSTTSTAPAPPASAPTTSSATPSSPTTSSSPPTTSAPASGRAAVAVSTALAQLGKPYVWGTAGPSTFDCSGLTMYAWAAAGVSLSHASSVQSQQGTPVAISDLQPGDLVFYYSPVSHVGMYIGNGQLVHAPHTGSVVQIVPVTSMPIAWARRVG